jgi:hypothetical protein
MDRQPLTDRLGDRLLAEYGGAAAAYSLRALNGNGDSVVRVRRASDNDEKDFTAEQIELGEMVNWVNSQTVPPLDIGVETSEGRIPVPEGGTSIGTPAAAYSLRNLSTTYTGNVVDVRRSGDDAEDSFTAAEVADGTLEAWVLAPVSSLIGNTMWFDGEDDYIVTNIGSAAGNGLGAVTISAYVLFSDLSNISIIWSFGRTAYRLFFDQVNGSSLAINQNQLTGFVPDINTLYFIEVDYNASGEGVELRVDGVTEWTGTAPVGDNNGTNEFLVGVRKAGATGAFFHNGLTYDVTISGTLNWVGNGNTDAAWVDQIGSNDGTVNGSPELFTGQGFDGFVSQWYDQSGNDNHATQGTAASQPKIVDGGSLVSGGLDFDGVDDSLFGGSVSLSQPFTSFSVSATDTTSRSAGIWSISAESGSVQATSFFRNDNGFAISSGATLTSAPTITYTPFTEYLKTDVFDTTSSEVFVNGSSVVSGDSGAILPTGGIHIGRYIALPNSFRLDGRIQEIIIYDSDQSDNRTAIEANIGETYGITGIPAYDNTVDGFVETWYDQSGNGNDATQGVAGSQPKIVDGGSLVTGGIVFDTGETLVKTGLSISSPLNTFVVSTADTEHNGAILKLATSVSQQYRTDRKLLLQYSDLLFTDSNVYTVGEQNLQSLQFVAGTSVGFFNGTQVLSGTTAGQTVADFRLGNTGSFGLDGKINEAIFYDSDQSANRVAIETNINDHYNIY